jgi:hypothetical protein
MKGNKTVIAALAALSLAIARAMPSNAQYHTPGEKTARSASGRYAIQERNGKPWLLDAVRGTQQFLVDETAGRQLVDLGFPSYDAQPSRSRGDKRAKKEHHWDPR